MKDPITALLAQLQPQAVAFNGYGVSKNPARWIGTEMGVAPDPNWSTGVTNDGGDPDSPIFCPAECDTTLQSEDRWFWVCVIFKHSKSVFF
jgi:alpha-L-fucosidase